jgi:adenylate cyclase
MRRWRQFVVPLALLVVGVVLRAADPGIVETLRLLVFDTFQRIEPREYQDAPVRIIDIDDGSLERLGQWPWPRTMVAELVTRLTELGAAVIVFDIVFAEPDRTSPNRVLPLWPDTPDVEALRQNISALPDHDLVLAEAIRGSNVVTAFVLTGGELTRPPALKKGFSFGGDDPRAFIPEQTGAVVNLDEIESAAAGNGGINVAGERDGIVRRMPTMLRLGDGLYPSLMVEALRAVQGGLPTVFIKSSGASGESGLGQHTGINNVKIGDFIIPTDGEGRLWLHYTRTMAERFIPAWAPFDPDFPRELVEGFIVLVGTSAAGLKDQRSTPVDPVVAGVEIHAQALEQVLLQGFGLGTFLVRPDWGDGAEIVYLVVMGLALALLLPWLGALWCAVIAVSAVVGVIAVSWYAYTEMSLLFDPVYPSVIVLLVYLVESLASFMRSEAEKRHVREAFSQYLSPALVEQLAAHPERLKLGGEMKPMTLLFCDIRDFTSISESYKSDPQGLTRLINRFLTPMTDLILESGGTIDKYMGDCIMAFWNAPIDDIAHARSACVSALAMIKTLETLNEQLAAEAESDGRTHIPLRVGIGLNSGTCCVGNMGAEQRFDYSVLGDDVNLAARLEGQSKTYGVDIVIGEQTYARADDFASIELDLIQVKGKREAVRIYALLGESDMRERPEFKELGERHQSMLAAYRGREWQEARELVAECRKLNSGLNQLYDLYDQRLSDFEANPPGSEWEGVYVAETK